MSTGNNAGKHRASFGPKRLTLAAALAGLVGLGPLLGVAHAADEDVNFLNKPVFRIPIQVLPDRAQDIKELRLFVSTDRGRTWTPVHTSKPDRKDFTFKAQADGEYWFTLAYVDFDGRMEPENVQNTPPGLKVVLDTKAPRIDLQPMPQQGDQVGIRWKIDDEKLDLSTLKIEIREESASTFHEIRVPKMAQGEAEWPVVAPGESIEVRAIVKDRAGNMTVRRADIPTVAQRPEMAGTDGRPGQAPRELDLQDQFAVPASPANQPGPQYGGQMPPQNGPQYGGAQPGPQYGSGQPGPQYGGAQPGPQYGGRGGNDMMVNSYGDRAKPAPAASTHPTYQPMATPPGAPVNSTSAHQGAFAGRDRYEFDRSRPDLPVDAPPAQAMATPQETPVDPGRVSADPQQWLATAANRIPVATTRAPAVTQVSSTSRKIPEPTQAAKKEPPTRKIPLISSTRFAVNYELRRVGPAGVGKVELFVTKDNGQSWELLGVDEDKQPPFEVNLPGEGRYGLRVVVTSRAGYGQKAPVPGDKPDIFVEVDTTAPEAELYQPVPDPESNTDSLLITWSARDLHLSDEPVGLYFAEYPEGPWYSIKTDLPSQGQYSWRLPSNIPYQVYLRLMAKDLCENVSVADTPEPVMVDLSRPEGEVIGIAVLPDGSSSR